MDELKTSLIVDFGTPVKVNPEQTQIQTMNDEFSFHVNEDINLSCTNDSPSNQVFPSDQEFPSNQEILSNQVFPSNQVFMPGMAKSLLIFPLMLLVYVLKYMYEWYRITNGSGIPFVIQIIIQIVFDFSQLYLTYVILNDTSKKLPQSNVSQKIDIKHVITLNANQLMLHDTLKKILDTQAEMQSDLAILNKKMDLILNHLGLNITYVDSEEYRKDTPHVPNDKSFKSNESANELPKQKGIQKRINVCKKNK